MEDNKFRGLFAVDKSIIGMIHLAGDGLDEKIKRAISELELYQEERIDGAIIEDYHANGFELAKAVKEISKRQWDIKLGINYLRNPEIAFELARENGLGFVQLDSVDGDLDEYALQRVNFPNLAVFGGVRFKYQPETGKTLEEDIAIGRLRCDAVVTTGEGTGIETPIEKLRDFKKYLGSFPFVVGAGVDSSNVYEQLRIADSAIIGSYFKPKKNTLLPLDRELVRDLMSIVKELRKNIP